MDEIQMRQAPQWMLLLLVTALFGCAKEAQSPATDTVPLDAPWTESNRAALRSECLEAEEAKERRTASSLLYGYCDCMFDRAEEMFTYGAVKRNVPGVFQVLTDGGKASSCVEYVNSNAPQLHAIWVTRNEAIAVGMPSGFENVSFLMSKEMFRAKRPRAVETNSGRWVETVEYGPFGTFIAEYAFSDIDSLFAIVLRRKSTHQDFAEMRAHLDELYGPLVPEESEENLEHATLVRGRVGIIHQLVGTQNAGLEESVMFYRHRE
ncbi:hypothetical protein [Microcoleus sp. AT13-A5]|uniref:hypothetical protein n=1 Tax=Microcoleus sp. AT13-A5 TaxID=2818590 RepID=UPI002FD04FBB